MVYYIWGNLYVGMKLTIKLGIWYITHGVVSGGLNLRGFLYRLIMINTLGTNGTQKLNSR